LVDTAAALREMRGRGRLERGGGRSGSRGKHQAASRRRCDGPLGRPGTRGVIKPIRLAADNAATAGRLARIRGRTRPIRGSRERRYGCGAPGPRCLRTLSSRSHLGGFHSKR
jgi:hypothetical protein